MLSDLSYVYVNNKGSLEDGSISNKVGEAALTGAATGAVLGGIVGLVIANGVLPGFGTLFVAGPLAAALGLTGVAATTAAAAATGATALGLVGALTHVGIAEQDVKLYEDHVRRGEILVIARDTPASTEDVFLNHGATAIKHYTTA